MTIKMSDDSGASWSVLKTVWPGPSAYSVLSVLSQDDAFSLGLVYERGVKALYETVTFTSLPL